MAVCIVKIDKQGKVESKRLEGEKFTFGRALENAIILQHESISRNHLEMAVHKGKVYLKDLGSSNGSSLNGKKFKSGEIKEYIPGDILKLGNAEHGIRIEVLSEEEAAKSESILPKFPISFSLGKSSSTPAAVVAPVSPSFSPVAASEEKAAQILKIAEEKVQEATQRAEVEAKKILQAAEIAANNLALAKETESVRQAETAARTAAAKVHEEARENLDASRLKAKKELEEARAEVEKIQERAQQDAAKIIEETKKAAAEMEKTAQLMLQQTKETTEKMLNLKKQEAEEEKVELLKKWEKEHKSLREEVQNLSQKLEEKNLQITQANNLEKDAQEKLKKREAEVKTAEQQVEQKEALLKDQEGKMDQIKARVEGFERQLTELKKEKEEALIDVKSIKSKGKNDSDALEKEYVNQKERIRVEMAELRQKELKDIQKLRLDELDNLDKLRRQALSDIQKNQDAFTKGLAAKLEGRVFKILKDSSGNSYESLKAEVHKVVLEGFDEQIFEIGQSFEKDIRTEVKAATLSRKNSFKKAVGFTAGAIMTFALLFIFQGGNLWNAVQGINESGLTAAEQYSRKMYTDRTGHKYQPVMVPGLKQTYTDNVLYTPSYVERVQSAEVREKWIKVLNKFLTRDLSLEDDSVVQLVSVESTLVSRLKTERDQINPEYVDISVKKMQKVEEESIAKIRKIFKTQAQYERYHKLAKEFWLRELQEVETMDADRLPANQ